MSAHLARRWTPSSASRHPAWWCICRPMIRNPPTAWRVAGRWPPDRLYLFQLLQAAGDLQFRRHRRLRKTGLPVGDADLADIDVAFRIQREAVRGEEFAGLETRTVLAAEPGDPLSLGVDDGEARTEIGHLAIDRHAGA